MPGRPLSELLAAAEESRARERAELARALHDDAGGRLTAAALDLTLLRMDAPPAWQPQLEALERKLELAFETVRGVSLSLAPDLAARIPLADALARLSESFGRRFEGSIELSIDAAYRPPPELALALYRIAELLLGFLTAECEARSLCLSLDPGPRLEIRSDLPIPRPQAAASLSVTLARYHSRKHNLRFMLGSSPQAGTIFLIGGREE
jgi:signal transduction histidine kinase